MCVFNVVLGFREWMPKWIRNNFKTSTGEPVKNAPLIRYLSALLDQRAREGQKVPIVLAQRARLFAHANRMYSRCTSNMSKDTLARKGTRARTRSLARVRRCRRYGNETGRRWRRHGGIALEGRCKAV